MERSHMTRSSGPMRKTSLAASMRSRMVSWDNTTPFEAPVVPDEKRMKAQWIRLNPAGWSRAGATGSRAESSPIFDRDVLADGLIKDKGSDAEMIKRKLILWRISSFSG